MVLTGMAVALGLALVALVIALRPAGSTPPGTPAASSHGPATPSGSAPVQVPSSLVGQPYNTAWQQLRALGLNVVVQWQQSGQPPNTVLGVQPSGQVPAGSTVYLTVANPNGASGQGGDHGGGDN
jgi:hypothetical protein